jgi:hypothetical protein
MSIKQNGHMAEVAHKNESKKRKRDELGGGLEDSHETKKKKRPKTKAEIEHNKQIYAKSKKYSRGSGPGVQVIITTFFVTFFNNFYAMRSENE